MFQVIADRAEKAAVIVTTNLPFSEWSQVIPQPRLCKALIDRLTDQAHIITTGADSYRFRRTTAQRKGGKSGWGGPRNDADLLSRASARLSRSHTGGWARIRQHKWANIHGHSQPSVPGSVTYSSRCPTNVRSGQRQRDPPISGQSPWKL
jgi:hypothetical protein